MKKYFAMAVALLVVFLTVVGLVASREAYQRERQVYMDYTESQMDNLVLRLTAMYEDSVIRGDDRQLYRFLALIDSMQFYEGSEFFCLSPYNYVYRLRDDTIHLQSMEEYRAWIGEDDYQLMKPLLDEMAAGHSDIMEIDFPDGPAWAVYHYLPRTQNSLCNICPYSVVRHMMRDKMVNIIWIAMVGMVLLCLLTVLGYQRLQQRLNAKMEELGQQMAINQRMDSELQISADIQQHIIAPPSLTIPSLSLQATLLPAREVGGDLYDYRLRDGRLYFCIGDVSGKGVPASLVMAICCSMFHAHLSLHEPARILQAINVLMSERNPQSVFVTLWIGCLNVDTGELSYANAGHNEPLWLHNGQVSPLHSVPSLPVGLFADTQYSEDSVVLSPADRLLLYTDGVTEAETRDHSQFGDEPLYEMLRQGSSIEQITAAIRHFAAGTEQSDDITMLQLDYQPRQFVYHTIADVGHLHDNLTVLSAPEHAELAIEEAIVNALMHGHATQVQLSRSIETGEAKADATAVFTLRYDGLRFDPTAYTAVDMSDNSDMPKSLDSPDIPDEGGQGIRLMRRLCSALSYEYLPTEELPNCLKMQFASSLS